LYNQIHELIRPEKQVEFMNYYNNLPSSYHHRLEEKDIDNLISTLHTYIEYEEKLERNGIHKGDYVKQIDVSVVL